MVYFKGAIMETFIELAKRLLEKSKRIKEGYASEQDLLSDNTQCVQKSTQGNYSKYAIPGSDEYSVKDISDFSNIPEWTLRRLIKSGKLKATVATDSKNPGKARFIVKKDNLKAFLNDNFDLIINKNEKVSDSKIKAEFANLIEDFNDVIEYGKLEIKRDEIDMKADSNDSLKVQRDIIEKQMMIKRLEIEKKFYQNYDFDCSDKSKQESSGLLGKIRNFLNQEL